MYIAHIPASCRFCGFHVERTAFETHLSESRIGCSIFDVGLYDSTPPPPYFDVELWYRSALRSYTHTWWLACKTRVFIWRRVSICITCSYYGGLSRTQHANAGQVQQICGEHIYIYMLQIRARRWATRQNLLREWTLIWPPKNGRQKRREIWIQPIILYIHYIISFVIIKVAMRLFNVLLKYHLKIRKKNINTI